MSSSPETPHPSRWQVLVSFLDTFRGRPNTDLVRRNSATIVCGLLWLIVTILCFPYQKLEIPSLPESHYSVETSVWFSPLSEWPVNVVEKGLNFSAEFNEVIKIWGDRSELGEKLEMGERIVDDLLSGLAELSLDHQLRVDNNDILIEYQQLSSTANAKITEYSSSIHNLANQINQTSTKVEQDLTKILHNFQKPDRYRTFSPSITTKIQKAFKPVLTNLSPLLEELVRKTENLLDTLLEMESALSILADADTHILEQRAVKTLLGFSRSRYRYRVRRRFPSIESLAKKSSINKKNVKAQADVLAGYYSEVGKLRGVVNEMKSRLTGMRIEQHVFGKWLAQDKLVVARTEEYETIRGLVALLHGNRGGLEQDLGEIVK
ncbi:hypothetical protein BKA61DRAFT_706683 [Leptodontidium sp. MPI-SDFR-AT-0119]|nr:hypothetical protein BKA61DRAFT_706683 [Leptodontidium sp. MPI-SDFR-AT-0119]